MDKKYLFVFDNGGTLINDPFDGCLKALQTGVGYEILTHAGVAPQDIIRFFGLWRNENRTHSFPLASHFLQEEIWPSRALLKLSDLGGISRSNIPEVSSNLLLEYRKTAKVWIAKQEQIKDVTDALSSIAQTGSKCGVASNDREIATKAMLSWCGLLDYFDWVFTSEGLSIAENEIIEKPNPNFFEKMEAQAFPGANQNGNLVKVYVGDSEQNDVTAPAKLGYITVRYFNRLNDSSLVWLDSPSQTSADYSFSCFSELHEIVDDIINNYY